MESKTEDISSTQPSSESTETKNKETESNNGKDFDFYGRPNTSIALSACLEHLREYHLATVASTLELREKVCETRQMLEKDVEALKLKDQIDELLVQLAKKEKELFEQTCYCIYC